MKCQSLFSGKNKKNIFKCHLLKILASMQSINIGDIRLTNREGINYFLQCGQKFPPIAFALDMDCEEADRIFYTLKYKSQ